MSNHPTKHRDPRPVSTLDFRIEAPPKHQDHCEAAFRRGVHQTVSDIYTALLAGATLEQIELHLDAVEAWREDRDGKLGYCPPALIDLMRREGKL